MPHDPLRTVLKLRKHGVDAARATVAEAIRNLTRADDVVRAREREMEDERRRASDPAGSDDLVESFAAWFPEGRRRLGAARTEQERLGAELARRRAELARSEVALETIETLIRRKAAEAAEAELRRGQAAVDEAAARRHAHPS